MTLRSALLAIALVLGGIGSTSCAKPTSASTPAAPNSPQTQLHNVNKTFADSINAAVKTAIQMRDQAKAKRDISCGDGTLVTITCTPDNAHWRSLESITRQIEDWAVPASVVSDKIEMEITSADSWPVQKQKVLLLLTGFQLPNTGPVDTTVQAALTAVGTLLSQLRAQVAQ